MRSLASRGSLTLAALALVCSGTLPGQSSPAVSAQRTAAQDSDWWAYQPVHRPAVPTSARRGWTRNPIDAFLLRGLEQNKLDPASPAQSIALLRRATYDLTGLPPTRQQADDFLGDHRPGAYERLIESLLASPQYGVKWGRHWLDLVRWAETDSYERDRRKPNAWRYRDWVIDAFNQDKPYDRFLTEQLAGDELPDRTLQTMIATGYYHLGIRDDEPTELLQAQFDDLDGILDTTSRVMLGMSMGCARCHDHKKDPISQREYYSMLACFENIKPYKQHGGNNVTMMNYVAAIPSSLGREIEPDQVERWDAKRVALVGRIRALTKSSGVHLDAEAEARIRSTAGKGLIAHWAFDQGADLQNRATAVSAKDKDKAKAKAEGHEAAVDDFDAIAFDTTSTADGYKGAALFFDGGDDYLQIRRPVQDDFSVSFWFRTASMGAGGQGLEWYAGSGLIDAEVAGVKRDFGISHHSNGRIVAGTGQPDVHLVSPPGYNDDRWHHVVFTRHRQSGRMRLYLDGYKVSAKTGSKHRLDAPATWNIGRLRTGINYYAGWIDELKIYDRVISAADVLALTYGEGFEVGLQAELKASRVEALAKRRQGMIGELERLTKPQAETTEILVVQEKGARPAPSFVRVRGNAVVKGEPVSPGVPAVVGGMALQVPVVLEAAETSMRRTALAAWITSAENPLTAKVMANRIWQHHFGRGLVRSTNDFGRLGTLPTHPDLLAWLGAEFVARGWSIKAMHRLIMTSSAYRMSSQVNTEAQLSDPRNDRFWRFDMRRLTAEEIRDSILSVTGTLELQMGGPGIYPIMPPAVLATSSRPDAAWGRSSAVQAARRSVYVHVKRSLLLPILQSHDLADTDSSCPQRFNTTQPTQALTMMNGDFMHAQAKLFRQRLEAEADGLPAQLRLGLRLVTQRVARQREVDQGLALIRDLQTKDGLAAKPAFEAWCLCALNLNEFVYLD